MALDAPPILLNIPQGQVEQLEKRNEELESKFSIMTKANLELQQTERELRDQGSIQ